VNASPLEAFGDRSNVERALENVGFLVYQGINEGDEMAYASVVLPMAAPAESDGTFTSMERRVQRLKHVMAPIGESKPAWRIFSEVGLRKRPSTPLFHPSEIMDLISQTVPYFQGVDYDTLPDEGYMLGAPAQAPA
jgi:predicted molibdopterin-dependent oxidoreductase YjgC